MKGGHISFNQSITGIKTATELKPALQAKQSRLVHGRKKYFCSYFNAKRITCIELNKVKEKYVLDNSMDRSFQDSFDADYYENIRPAMFPTKIFTCPPKWKKRKLEPMDTEEDKNGDLF